MSDAQPLLDTVTALGRIRGKVDLYRRLLQQAEPHRQAGQRLQQALAAADWAGMAAISHRIAGVAASLGAERLATVARTLQADLALPHDAGQVPDPAAFVVHVCHFQEVLQQTFHTIDAYLAQAPNP